MAAKKDAISLDDLKEVMLTAAQKMLEANNNPSTDLQVQIIKSANELVKTVVDIQSLKAPF